MDTLLARVMREIEGGARIHTAYVFANRGATRLKVRVYDGAGLRLCNRHLQAGRFIWCHEMDLGAPITITPSATALAYQRGSVAALKKLLLGQPIEKAVNRDAMANPGCLDWYVALVIRRQQTCNHV